jgi:ribonuclease HI
VVSEYQIVFDGGSKGNPGPGYGSFVIVQDDEPVLHEHIGHGDWLTNNEAEYLTLIEALTRLLQIVGDARPETKVSIFGDSQLVINQVNGLWKIKKPELRELRQRVIDLLHEFGGYEVKWHARANSVLVLGH